MTHQLTYQIAQQRIADLRRTADQERLALANPHINTIKRKTRMPIEQFKTRARRLIVAIVVVALTAAVWVSPAFAGGGNFGG